MPVDPLISRAFMSGHRERLCWWPRVKINMQSCSEHGSDSDYENVFLAVNP